MMEMAYDRTPSRTATAFRNEFLETMCPGIGHRDRQRDKNRRRRSNRSESRLDAVRRENRNLKTAADNRLHRDIKDALKAGQETMPEQSTP